MGSEASTFQCECSSTADARSRRRDTIEGDDANTNIGEEDEGRCSRESTVHELVAQLQSAGRSAGSEDGGEVEDCTRSDHGDHAGGVKLTFAARCGSMHPLCQITIHHIATGEHDALRCASRNDGEGR